MQIPDLILSDRDHIAKDKSGGEIRFIKDIEIKESVIYYRNLIK